MSESPKFAEIVSDVAARVARSANRDVATLRRLRRQVSRELRREVPETVVRVARQLARSGEVPRWFSYELLSHDARAMAILDVKGIEDLGQGMSTWGDVDAWACYVAGPAWREGRIETEDVVRWSASCDRWWRRAALVSTVPLNNTSRGGRGDAGRTVEICDLLRRDRDDLVVKALSWALRELAKKEPKVVEAYLAKREAELASRVLREVRNKLRTGRKTQKPHGTGA